MATVRGDTTDVGTWGTLPVKTIVMKNMKRTLDMFVMEEGKLPQSIMASQKLKVASKLSGEYATVKDGLSSGNSGIGGGFDGTNGALGVKNGVGGRGGGQVNGVAAPMERSRETEVTRIIQRIDKEKIDKARQKQEEARKAGSAGGSSLVLFEPSTGAVGGAMGRGDTANQLVVSRRAAQSAPRPDWHAPWKLSAVMSGHLGWVRAIAFEPGNEWFVTGAADRTIKVWDLAKVSAGASDGLKLTLTGHINCIRGLAVSPRHPYLFSAGEDKKVMCWDLEYNRVVRHYHGHLSGVHCLSLHPTLDILVTGGRDSVARVWDMRTKQQIHALAGHTNAVGTLATNAVEPQVITGSHDCQVKLWDLVAGKAMTTLTHHKKAVRALKMHPKEFSFVSAAADNMKKWQASPLLISHSLLDGVFLNNISGHNTIINTLAVNEDGVLVSGGDNGSLCMWDYATGYGFQRIDTVAQPGSLDAEAGIFASTFDMSGSRLVTCEADKTVKIWKEDTAATPETHPVDMADWAKAFQARKR
ncbi:unnamed protein product [Choristocarpus tenellus]